MSEKEKLILQTICNMFPLVDDADKDHLLWIAQGMAIKAQKDFEEMQKANPPDKAS